jgi:hypothetical protein
LQLGESFQSRGDGSMLLFDNQIVTSATLDFDSFIPVSRDHISKGA